MTGPVQLPHPSNPLDRLKKSNQPVPGAMGSTVVRAHVPRICTDHPLSGRPQSGLLQKEAVLRRQTPTTAAENSGKEVRFACSNMSFPSGGEGRVSARSGREGSTRGPLCRGVAPAVGPSGWGLEASRGHLVEGATGVFSASQAAPEPHKFPKQRHAPEDCPGFRRGENIGS